jgi:hypothetical protein
MRPHNTGQLALADINEGWLSVVIGTRALVARIVILRGLSGSLRSVSIACWFASGMRYGS